MSWLSDKIGDSLNSNNYFGSFSNFGGGGQSGDLSSLATLAGAYGSRPISLEDIEFQKYADPEAFVAREMFDPESLSDTELRSILSNERLSSLYGNQEDVLSRLGEYSQEGMSAIDKARLADIQNEINQQNRGNQEAILQNMAQRGLAGSGSELAARLNAQQGASQAGFLAGSDIAGQAAQRAFDSLQSEGAYATGLQQQQYGQLSNAAQAQDIINQYNTQMKNTVGMEDWRNQQNIANMNTAARNQIKQQNVDLANQATQYNVAQKPMQQYAMQSNQAQMAMQGLGNQANISAQNAAANQQFWGGLIGSGIQGGSYAGGQYLAKK